MRNATCVGTPTSKVPTQVTPTVYSLYCGFSSKLQPSTSLLRRGFTDFLVSSYTNALDDKHFSSNAGDAMHRQGEMKYHKNKSKRNLCQIFHPMCTKGMISVPSVKTGQGDGRAYHFTARYINRRYGHIVLNCQTKCMVSFFVFCIVFF